MTPPPEPVVPTSVVVAVIALVVIVLGGLVAAVPFLVVALLAAGIGVVAVLGEVAHLVIRALERAPIPGRHRRGRPTEEKREHQP